jgi:DNA-directed RNA polymerase subunit H (RpoH/RPB5)
MSNTREKQAIKVLTAMLIDRDITIEYTDPEYTLEKEYVICGKNDSKILCFIHNDDKLNIQGIKDKLSIMNKEGVDKCIIVYKNSVTSSAKKSIDTIDYTIELFSMDELQLNITHHRIFPKHEKSTSEEKEELEKKYKGKLPVLLSSDVASRYYNFKKGEYVRITRKDGSIIYRIVK